MNEDENSDSESMNASIIGDLKSTNFSHQGRLPDDRLQYKNDKKCICCQTQFGLGILYAKKHYCKFCYRGICAKCSPAAAMHPEERKALRICNLCCEKSVEDKFSEGYNIKISSIRQEIDNLKEQKRKNIEEYQKILKDSYRLENLIFLEEERNKELIGKFSESRDTTRNVDETKKVYEIMYAKHQELYKVFDQRNYDISRLRKMLESEQERRQSTKTELISMRDKLTELQDDFLCLQSKGHRKSSSMIFTEAEKKEDQMLNSLVISNFEIESESSRFKQEIDKLESENEFLDKKIKNLKEEAQNAPDRLVNNEKGLYSVDEEERIRNLKIKHKTQQAMIERLRTQCGIGSKNTKDRELRGKDEDEEETVNESTRPCARCRIF